MFPGHIVLGTILGGMFMLTIIDEVFGSMTEEEFRSKPVSTITETEAKKLTGVTAIEPITISPDDILLGAYKED